MPVIYYLESRENKKHERPIRMSAIVLGTRIQSTTGFSIAADSWDKDKMRVKPHQTNAKKQTSAQINKFLSGVETKVLDFENTCKVRPSVDKLKDIIASYDPNVDPDAAPEEEPEAHQEPQRPSAVRLFKEFCMDDLPA